MNTPKIEIKGVSASGKSALARAIQSALMGHGIECAITGAEDDVAGVMKTQWKDRLKCLFGKTLHIETVRVSRIE